jgi:hypothetical protein
VDAAFGNAGRPDEVAGDGREVGEREFVDVGRDSAEVAFILPANSSETMLTTNSWVARTSSSVSFCGRGPLRTAATKQTTGGLVLAPVK